LLLPCRRGGAEEVTRTVAAAPSSGACGVEGDALTPESKKRGQRIR